MPKKVTGWAIPLSALWLSAWGMLPAYADTPSSVLEEQYQLGTGDVITIRVFGEDELSLEVRLSDSGVINYPFLGEIQVAGFTASLLEKKIAAGLLDGYMVNPSVEVTIKEYRSFFVDGEVNTPGSYAFLPGLTINKAIAMASGLTPRASQRKIIIKRGHGENQEVIEAEMDTKLYPGDIITVKQSFF
ncbi:polysaccharide export protein [Microbulbifer bruguierae]|uniref:Polysaccharide export protein n=1 Tax=Microbulbifer bruguierae TaxID=3029061 RepID=A0ABY8NI21_9GAMM|nr:polysaccharide biosynthesis/export family protein [Microbulbifer bruguierae]WGL18237.1 polysaccharide export protein [Microbulbifer bruguierae]